MNTISNPTGRVRLGMVGFGIAARAFLPALAQRPEFELVAIVDPVEQIRTEAAAEFGIATYARIE
ncbi:Gfo/Idh/MocA family oxidoreductase, partial [Acinetobacter baumannii]|uniref:Gfo/Idh/MocA family oxidoreductase n=3 Tax=Pseudomonadota TaxID=1224 RepID=UPI0037D6A548